MTFEFATAGRTHFGLGISRQVPALARDLGRHALVVLGGSDRGREALTQGPRRRRRPLDGLQRERGTHHPPGGRGGPDRRDRSAATW